ncbi:molecular chaperone Tir [Pseudomonas putida]|uniref:molecular chaperone Tir n=1 Tax=Pseudomonas putida TaxID=303 RepID=UPI000DB58560|nr:molecular chaperone Tir [Pseudomonas putida]MBI6940765.1 molecular chaperone Tir [Pseudomonas putida]MBI6956963.1 molecular chaperone Tir [Pseudomonas putida]PZQ37546.1 MAG: molecular chaperone Tir [Pseudomonas putida]
MPVFISYRHEQRLDAFILNERLLLEGITAQLVLLDSAGQTSEDLFGSFCQHMNHATHWIGLLPESAAEDWWTAWLLGAAVMACRRVGLYYRSDAALPDCLGKWPVMRKQAHIDLFVRAYHDECTFARAMALPGVRGGCSDRDNADFFHADLKAKIRREF